MKYLIIILALSLLMNLVIKFAFSHESHGFKHMTEPSGFLISTKWCPSGSVLWSGDDNEDGVVDNCRQVILSHDKFHVLELPVHIIDGNPTCVCKENE